ncbi:MAG: molecular chaperone TorD family protein [Eggerthellaceae bacterium]|nr:molecular chaperone TorD family protein [Eggerthellaceae bacterium]
MTVSADVWQTRAALCELLALGFRYPEGDDLTQAVASGEWIDAAREIAEALGLDWVPSELLTDGVGDADACGVGGLGSDGAAIEPPSASDLADVSSLRTTLRAEATRLFVGAPDPEVSPYEGVWRAADDGVQALLFVNPHSMAVERFMKECGLGRPEGTNEPLDALWTELEFLQLVCMFESGMTEPPEGARLAEGDSWAAVYERFLAEHVLTWAPRFAEKVRATARVSFYRETADLLAAFMKAAAQRVVKHC